MCTVCGKSISAYNFKKHMIIHTGETIKCKICGKVVKNEESLRGHMVMHKKQENICHICGKTFQYKGEYKNHVYQHRGGCLHLYLM